MSIENRYERFFEREFGMVTAQAHRPAMSFLCDGRHGPAQLSVDRRIGRRHKMNLSDSERIFDVKHNLLKITIMQDIRRNKERFMLYLL